MNVTQEGSDVRVVDVEGVCYRIGCASAAAARRKCARMRQECGLPHEAAWWWSIAPSHAWAERSPHDHMTPHPERWAVLDASIEAADRRGCGVAPYGDVWAAIGPGLLQRIQALRGEPGAGAVRVGVGGVTGAGESLCPELIAECIGLAASDTPIVWTRALVGIGDVAAVVVMVIDPVTAETRRVGVIMPTLEPPTTTITLARWS